jgi:hypothetical protein
MSRSIYDITHEMMNQDVLRTDLQQAAELASSYFQNKYTNKLAKAVQCQREKAQETPPDEVKLLAAIKPFLRPNQQETAERLIGLCRFASAAQSIGNELRQSVYKPYPYTMRGADALQKNGLSHEAKASVREDLLGMLLLMAFK